jgi:hypothetical protein
MNKIVWTGTGIVNRDSETEVAIPPPGELLNVQAFAPALLQLVKVLKIS